MGIFNMTSLKDHQAAMVDLLANGSALSSSGSRLAHALHDVLAYLNDTNAAPQAHTERRIDATTPGLNDALLAEAFGMGMSNYFGAFKTLAENSSSVTEQQSRESLLKWQDEKIRHLEGRVAEVVDERDWLRGQLEEALNIINLASAESFEPEQAGCRKPDTEGGL